MNSELPTHSALMWRPIATAPKHKQILLYSEDWEATLGAIQVGTVDDKGNCLVAETDVFNASHWLPLPQPPEEFRE